jgi:hypothetical protein
MAKTILKVAAGVGGTLLGGPLGVGALAGGLIGSQVGKAVAGGGKKKEAAVPMAEAAPRVMPLADDEAIRRAKLASMSRQRAGRSSTMLSEDSETLGA